MLTMFFVTTAQWIVVFLSTFVGEPNEHTAMAASIKPRMVFFMEFSFCANRCGRELPDHLDAQPSRIVPALGKKTGRKLPLNLTILHTNDLHGKLTAASAAQILELKTENTVYVDSGDCTKSGNLAVPLKADPAWALLAAAGCDAGVIGNRESQVLPSAFRGKILAARHPLLCGNLRSKRGRRPLPGSLILDRAGLKIGLIGVMVPMVTERMATRGASAYLWDQPIPVACALAEELRPQVDCLIALTHIGYAEDLKLAEACPLLDLVLGGHSHLKLDSPARVGSAWILQTGSHAHFVGRYEWSASAGLVGAELIPLVG